MTAPPRSSDATAAIVGLTLCVIGRLISTLAFIPRVPWVAIRELQFPSCVCPYGKRLEARLQMFWAQRFVLTREAFIHWGFPVRTANAFAMIVAYVPGLFDPPHPAHGKGPPR